MKKKLICIAAIVLGCAAFVANAQVPVTAGADQQAMLKSKDPKLAANKKLVYDMWRELLEAGHLELAEKYLAEDYIQHNPLAATGRKGFVDFFTKIGRKPVPIEPQIKRGLVSVVAEGDLVVLSFVNELPNPNEPGKKYTTTWFDMFRIENGKIAEHWDSQTITARPAAPPAPPKP
jgi:predicted SnoaL-like aldol condensation-catalyzing enzyme